ncbi:MAG: DNA/RNA nuclease SfsA [Pyrobaculum sp.]
MYFPIAPPDRHGVFVKRLNRFLGVAEVDGAEEYVHIHDPGRLEELLYPGARIWVREKRGGKARFYLTAVDLGDELVLVDSAVHNKIAAWLIENGHVLSGYRLERLEPRYGGGRFDLLLRAPGGKSAFVEVKGVTLEKDGVALFPDAPTARGARHMEHLAEAVAEGYEGYVLFLVFRKKAARLSPNWETDPKFSSAFVKAVGAGVGALAAKLEMFKWGLRFAGLLPLDLRQ